MHILMTADTVGGVWTYARELVTGLLRRGHRVTLVSFGGPPTPEQTNWIEPSTEFIYHSTPYRLEWMQECADDIDRSTAWLQQLVEEVEPDLLHFNQFAYGALETGRPKVVVAHSDVVSWGVNTRDEQPPDNSWLRSYRDFVNKGLSSADIVITPSQWMLQALKTYYSVPAEARVIYNARDSALFVRNSAKEECVVSVGRLWDEAKQVSLLAGRSHPVPVYIAGSVAHPETPNVGSAVLNENTNIRWLGPQTSEGLRDLYAKAAIYAGTSRYEPFGLAPLEAALSGCALLLNDIPSFRELWGDTACYFERNNADSLAREIRLLVRDRELRKQFAARAYALAITAFSSDHMVDSYERVYHTLVRQEAYA